MNAVLTSADVAGAEVRFRYQARADERTAARAAAEVVQAELLALGAVSVKLEEDVITEKRAKAPEIALAVTAGDKLEAYWRSKGYDPGARRAALLAKAALLEQECSDGKPKGVAAPLRLERVRYRDMGPFADLEINFEQLGEEARLIAVQGENGAGKTFLVESALPGAAYRKMPTHGAIAKRARGRDGLVEVTAVTDQRWTIRQHADQVSQKGEAVVLVGGPDSKTPAYEGTSVKKFDAWAAQHMPSADVLFQTQFSYQKSEGFVELDSAERIQLIMKLKNVDWLERVAKAARERARGAEAEVEKAHALLDAERERTGDAAELERVLALLQAAEAAAGHDATVAARALAQAEVEAKARAELAEQADKIREARALLEGKISEARERVADLTTRVANNRAVLAEGVEIRAAVAKLQAIATELEHVDKDAAAGAANLAAAQAQVAECGRNVVAVAREIAEIQQRAERATARLVDADAVHQAAIAIPDLQAAVLERGGDVQEATYALERVRGKRLAGADERIEALRGGLERIVGLHDAPCSVNEAVEIANDTVTADDAAVELAEELPVQLEAAHAALATAGEALAAAQRKLAETERQAARAGELSAARADQEAATQALLGAEERHDSATSAQEEATERLALVQAAQASSRTLRLKLQQDRTRLEPLAAKADPLARAEARLAELEPQLMAAQAELAQAEHNLSAAPALPNLDLSPAPALAEFINRAEAAQAALRQKQAAVAIAGDRLELARKGAARNTELAGAHDAAEAELADWNRIGLDFGRDGLQSAEVDSAGPELTETTNDLLRTCHGSRFTVSVDTSRLNADGKELVSECVVQVIDTVGGGEREIREFSGGERTILAEALFGALTLLACRRTDLRGATLVRDESGAAVGERDRPAYVRMLRRIGELVGASRTLFITHDKQSAEMCDARIRIEDGKATYS